MQSIRSSPSELKDIRRQCGKASRRTWRGDVRVLYLRWREATQRDRTTSATRSMVRPVGAAS
eukprot:4356414-Pyramimonas_sp.AAC.1